MNDDYDSDDLVEPTTATDDEPGVFVSGGAPYSQSSPSQASGANGGLFSTLLAFRRAFSIDEYYMRAEIRDDDNMMDDEDEDASNGQDLILQRRRLSDTQRPESARWRCIALAVLGLLFATSIAMTLTSRRRRRRTVLPDQDEDFGFCDDPIAQLRPSASIEGVNGAVAADHPLCSEMGTTIMRDHGGNAIDAAVTVALCLGVANPASSGLGGGAFMLIHADPAPDDEKTDSDNKSSPDFVDARSGPALISSNGKITEVIDCREIAPEKSSTDMYGDADQPKSASVFGGLAVPVPGELRGLELAHARHGKLPWADVVEPVMRLAGKGVQINPNLAGEIKKMADRYDDSSTDYGLRHLLTRGDSWTKPLREEELLQNQRLAELLEDIMTDGSQALYNKRAATLAQEIQDAGGIVTQSDIENYRATLRSPIFAHDVSDVTIVGVPPPSSGSAAMIFSARFLSKYVNPLASYADTLSVHRLVEACRHAFAIRMSLSDPAYNTDTVEDAVNDLTSGTYVDDLQKATKDNTTLPMSQYGGSKWAQLKDTDGAGNASDAHEGDRHRRRLARHFGYLNDHGTSHFSIVDSDGNAVAMTTSINTYFGSQVVSKSTGIIFSNTMDDFANPGKTNHFGLKPSKANYIKPGKKPLSSMAPSMVFRRLSEGDDHILGDLALVIGASGGPKIITAVLQVLLNTVMMGWPLFESIVHPRVHDQLIYHNAAVTTTEKTVLLQGPEISVSQRTKDALAKRGHRLLDIDYTGVVQAIAIDPETGQLTAVSDVRKGGIPDGF